MRPSQRTSRCQPAALATSTSDPAGFNNIDENGMSTFNEHSQAIPLPHPHLKPSGSSSNLTAAIVARSLPTPVPSSHPSPEYDFVNEENFPSPFLNKEAAAKHAAVVAAAALSSSNPSNVLATSRPSSSSKGPQSADGGSGLRSSSRCGSSGGGGYC